MDGDYVGSVASIGRTLRRIEHLIDMDSRRVLREFGVTRPQSLVIRSASNLPEPQSSAALSRLLDITQSNMTGIIDRLVGKGLVTRSQMHGDRRTFLIELTEKGRELGQSLPDLTKAKLEVGLANLKPAEVARIHAALCCIIRIYEGGDEAATPVGQT